MKLTISKSFSTAVPVSDRVTEVATMFGIGLDADRRFTVLDNVTIDLLPGQVIYITGQSGSGKSVLLREIARHLGASASGPEPEGIHE